MGQHIFAFITILCAILVISAPTQSVEDEQIETYFRGIQDSGRKIFGAQGEKLKLPSMRSKMQAGFLDDLGQLNDALTASVAHRDLLYIQGLNTIHKRIFPTNTDLLDLHNTLLGEGATSDTLNAIALMALSSVGTPGSYRKIQRMNAVRGFHHQSSAELLVFAEINRMRLAIGRTPFELDERLTLASRTQANMLFNYGATKILGLQQSGHDYDFHSHRHLSDPMSATMSTIESRALDAGTCASAECLLPQLRHNLKGVSSFVMDAIAPGDYASTRSRDPISKWLRSPTHREIILSANDDSMNLSRGGIAFINGVWAFKAGTGTIEEAWSR